MVGLTTEAIVVGGSTRSKGESVSGLEFSYLFFFRLFVLVSLPKCLVVLTCSFGNYRVLHTKALYRGG